MRFRITDARQGCAPRHPPPDDPLDDLCHGWTSSVRPFESITSKEKRASMAACGDKRSTSRYEYDHLIPLELGGAVARMVTAFAWRLLVAPLERRRYARCPAWAGDGGLVGADLSRDYCCTESRHTSQATRRAVFPPHSSGGN
jgi:hypothetical protein